MPIKDLEKRRKDNRDRRAKEERKQIKALKEYKQLLNSPLSSDEVLEAAHRKLLE